MNKLKSLKRRILSKDGGFASSLRYKGKNFSHKVIKSNRYGDQQNRILLFSEGGISNMKGNTLRWFFPAEDVFAVNRHPIDASRVEISVIKKYWFQCEDPQSTDELIKQFYELYSESCQANSKKFPPLEEVLKHKNETTTHGRSANTSYSDESDDLDTDEEETVAGKAQKSLTSTVFHPKQASKIIVAANPTDKNEKKTLSLVQPKLLSSSGSMCILLQNFIQFPPPPYSSKDFQNEVVSVLDFDFLKILGKGSFSSVVLVRKKDTKELYALKILSKEEIIKRGQIEHTNTEMLILSSYSNPFIISSQYFFESEKHLYMCLEFAPGGELFQIIRKEKKLSEAACKFYAAEIICGLEFLHCNGIIYRDLKPENVLLDNNGHVKIADFGLSKIGVTSTGGITEFGLDGQRTSSFCGTPEYVAPEILKGSHGLSVDLWSLGAMIFEMLTGKPPFAHKSRNALYDSILKGNYTTPSFISPTALDLIRKLLVQSPENRLGAIDKIDEENKENETFENRVTRGFQKLKNHKFFEDIDWNLLQQGKAVPPFVPIKNKSSYSTLESAGNAAQLIIGLHSRDKSGNLSGNVGNYLANSNSPELKKLDSRILDELGVSESDSKK